MNTWTEEDEKLYQALQQKKNEYDNRIKIRLVEEVLNGITYTGISDYELADGLIKQKNLIIEILTDI